VVPVRNNPAAAPPRGEAGWRPAGMPMTATDLGGGAATLGAGRPAGQLCATPGCGKQTWSEQPGQKCSRCTGGSSATMPRPKELSRVELPRGGAGGRSATAMPQTDRVLTPEMLNGGRGAPTEQRGMRIPQTTDQLGPSAEPREQRPIRIPQKEQISAAPKAKSQEKARCQKCSVSENLRRVRCCSVHYCVGCLSELISFACSGGAGGQLFCLACLSPWDIQKLAAACNLQLPANATSAQPRRSLDDTFGPSPTLGGAAATLPHRASAGYQQQQQQQQPAQQHQTLR